MDFKSSKDSGGSNQQDAPGEKKKQSTLLVLLLILVGGFAYIYFFTGLIKPQEAQKTAEVSAPAPEIVKMPMPLREGESAKPAGKTPGKAETPKAAATVPEEAAAPVAKPAAVQAKPAPAAKPVQAPVKPKEEPKKVASAKPADKNPQAPPVADNKGEKTPAVKAEAKKPAADAKKPVAADKKSSPSKDSATKAGSDSQAKQSAVVKAKKADHGPWSLVVGNYVLEEALSADMGRVRKAGFEPIVKPSARKKTTMNRLFVSEFSDRGIAHSTLEKLKRHTSDAFIIEQNGKFDVYAGSYLQVEAAGSEKERLKAAGFTTIVKHADIAIPSQSLSVGPFNSKKAADSARGKLKGAGIKTTLSQK
jgi:cell division septation protein DedD